MKLNIGAMAWEPVLVAAPYERDDLPVVELTDQEYQNIELAFQAFDAVQKILWDKVDAWQSQQSPADQ